MNSEIFNTKYWKVILADDQYYLGRCYIPLIRKCGSLSELKPEEWDEFLKIIKRLESTFKKEFGAVMFNWSCLMNNAYRVKNPKPHVHFHMKPRYDKKVKILGEVFEDKEFGNHYQRDIEKEVSQEVREEILRRLRE